MKSLNVSHATKIYFYGTIAARASCMPTEMTDSHMHTTQTPCPWLADTLELLSNAPRKLTLAQIAASCNVSVSFLSKLQSREINNPSIEKTYSVYKFLKDSTNV